MTRTAAFSLTDVSVHYGTVPALCGVSLEVLPGESVALVGPSGSGKTTLLRAVNGSVRASSGVVRVDGRALPEMTERELRLARSSIGVVHQDLRLVPNLRAVHNVVAGRLGTLSLAASLRAMVLLPRALEIEAHEVLDRVGIGDKLHHRTDRLSGGEQQRVAIARALFQRPASLLADEPIASVDPARARDLIEMLSRLSRESGLTLCVSLHNPDLAREFFPRLVGLRHGRVVFDRNSDSLSESELEALYRLVPTDGSRAV